MEDLKRYFVDPVEEGEDVRIGQRYKNSDIWIGGQRYVLAKAIGEGAPDHNLLVVRSMNVDEILGFLNKTPEGEGRIYGEQVWIDQEEVNKYSIEDRRKILRAAVGDVEKK